MHIWTLAQKSPVEGGDVVVARRTIESLFMENICHAGNFDGHVTPRWGCLRNRHDEDD